MLRFSMRDEEPEVIAESEGVAVYLDNDSISNLATGAQSRRERFADALQRGGTLLFSWMNAVELWSSDAVRVFLDSIGPAWIPVEMNPWILAQRGGWFRRTNTDIRIVYEGLLSRAELGTITGGQSRPRPFG